MFHWLDLDHVHISKPDMRNITAMINVKTKQNKKQARALNPQRFIEGMHFMLDKGT